MAVFLKGTPFGLLASHERFRQVYAFNLIEPVGRALIVGGIVMAGQELKLEAIVWASVISGASATAIAYAYLIKDILSLRHVKMKTGIIRDYLRFSLSTFLSSTLKAGNQNIDTLVLGYVAGPSTVGVYNLMRQFLSPLGLLAAPFSGQLYPRFVQAVAQHRREDMRHTIVQVNRRMRPFFYIIIAAAASGFALYVKWLDVPWSMDQAGGFAALALSGFILQQMWWNRPLTNAIDPNISLRANALASIILLVLIGPMTYHLGLSGSALSVLVVAIALLFYWRRVLASL
jgi:O-antigen/teichoic acid export membrane protein